jgi:hypothetical protein
VRRGLIFMFGVLACSHSPDQSSVDSSLSMDAVLDIGGDAVVDIGGIPVDSMVERSDMAQIRVDSSVLEDDAMIISDVAVSRDVSIEPDAAVLDAGVGADAMVMVDMSPTQDAMITVPIEECFPEQQNGNLSAVSVEQVPSADGAEVCNAGFAAELDGNVAELGFTGGAPAFIDGQEVSACLGFDFGRTCALDEHVGVLISSGAVAQACNPEGEGSNGQCDVERLCGDRPGASVLLFAGAQPQSLRFLARVGNCGVGTALNSLTPITAFSGAATLEGVRYVYACRPSLNCDADAGDVTIDGLFLIWR